MLGTYHLTALFDILNKIHFVYEPEKLWQFVLEQASQTLQSEAGSYFQISEVEKTLKLTASYGVEVKRLSQVPFQIGTGISGWVAQYHQPALVNDVRQDNRFNSKADLLTGFQTKSILCVPIFSQMHTYGVIEIINRKSGQFSPQDQEFMTLLGRQAAIAYQNLLLVQELSSTKTLLESLLANLSGGLVAMDLGGKMTLFNPAAAQILQIKGELVGRPAKLVFMDEPWFLETLEKTLASKSTVSRAEVTLPIQGQSMRIGYTTIIIADQGKNTLGAGIIFQRLSS